MCTTNKTKGFWVELAFAKAMKYSRVKATVRHFYRWKPRRIIVELIVYMWGWKEEGLIGCFLGEQVATAGPDECIQGGL